MNSISGHGGVKNSAGCTGSSLPPKHDGSAHGRLSPDAQLTEIGSQLFLYDEERERWARPPAPSRMNRTLRFHQGGMTQHACSSMQTSEPSRPNDPLEGRGTFTTKIETRSRLYERRTRQ